MGNIKILNDSNFKEGITDGVVVVDFYADWCGPCKMMAPVFQQAADDYEGRVVFAKINIDENRDTTVSNNIMSVPTLFFYKDGKAVGRVSGVLDKGTLYSKLNSLL